MLRSLSFLAAALVLTSCQSGPSSSPAGPLTYSVKRNPPAAAGTSPSFVIEAAFGSKGDKAQPHILVVYDTKWATLSLGEAEESARSIEMSEDSENPVPVDVGNFSGIILAVRCRDEKEGLINVDLRVYRAKGGRIIGMERTHESMPSGTAKQVSLPW